jgi:phosphatidylinositol-3-phosphatase
LNKKRKIMKKLILFIFALGLFSCDRTEPGVESPAPESTVGLQERKAPDHIIFVWFENKNVSQIIGSDYAPYINSLMAEGTYFSDYHAVGHPSYPEYIRFFSGTRNGKTDDACLDGRPYNTANLYTALHAKGESFAWYSEDLPATGSDVCSSGAYVERHNPTQAFSNVPLTANKKLSDLPTDYDQLETVVCITPNMNNDMHNGSINQGDTWLRTHLDNLVDWCKTHNSVFIVYFDEDNGTAANHIPVIAVGQNIKVNYISNIHYDHYNMTRTLCDIYKATPMANATTSTAITDWWK